MLNICQVKDTNSIKLEAVDLQFAMEQSNWEQAQNSTEQQQDGIFAWEMTKKQLKTSSERTEVSLQHLILLLNNRESW